MTQTEDLKTEWVAFRCTKDMKEELAHHKKEWGGIAASALVRDRINRCPILERVLLVIVPLLSLYSVEKVLLELNFEEKKEFNSFRVEE